MRFRPEYNKSTIQPEARLICTGNSLTASMTYSEVDSEFKRVFDELEKHKKAIKQKLSANKKTK